VNFRFRVIEFGVDFRNARDSEIFWWDPGDGVAGQHSVWGGDSCATVISEGNALAPAALVVFRCSLSVPCVIRQVFQCQKKVLPVNRVWGIVWRGYWSAVVSA